MANESSGKKALKAGLGYTVGNMLVKGLSFLAIPLFARLMTVEDFGIYSTFSSYVMIMTVLAGFTLHTSVRNAKLDYAERTGSYCSSVTLLVIGNSLLLLALSLVFAAPLARVLSLEQPYLPALIVLESFGMAMLTFYNSVLSVDYKYKEYLVLSLVYAVAGIGGSVLLILTLCRGQGYLGRILGTLIPAVLVGIYVVVRLWRKERPLVSREYWRYGMGISLPTVPHGLSQLLLNQFDRIMIKSIIGSTEAGLYSFAYNVGMIFQVITNSMDTAWAPWFFEKMKAREYPAIRRAASAYVVFVSIGAMALALISPEVILIAGGKDKGISYAPLGPVVNDRVKLLLLCGKTAGVIREAVEQAENYHGLEILDVADYHEAVAIADARSQPGDVVILSPASTSFDRFANFMERGQVFKAIVNELK